MTHLVDCLCWQQIVAAMVSECPSTFWKQWKHDWQCSIMKHQYTPSLTFNPFSATCLNQCHKANNLTEKPAPLSFQPPPPPNLENTEVFPSQLRDIITPVWMSLAIGHAQTSHLGGVLVFLGKGWTTSTGSFLIWSPSQWPNSPPYLWEVTPETLHRQCQPAMSLSHWFYWIWSKNQQRHL